MEEPLTLLTDYIHRIGFGPATSFLLGQVSLVFALLVLCHLFNALAKRLVLRLLRYLVKLSSIQWDDVLLKSGVFDNLAHLAPALVIYGSTPLVFPYSPEIQTLVSRLVIAYFVLIGNLILSALLNALVEMLSETEFANQRPITVYAQVVKIILGIISAILIFAILLDRSPWALLSGLGAMTAIIMLVFKDSILGFVASLHLTNNDMVRRGDWIEMPKYGADGDVIDVTLTTVKVQNFDKTISTIPTYSLVADSFKNWRGMKTTGARRIKRAILLDVNSIGFCSAEQLSAFENIALLKKYLDERRKEIARHNQELGLESGENYQVNGRGLTNIGIFRAYVLAYLQSLPVISKEQTLLVRQLKPTELGLPLEVYCFTNDTRWAHYESIQADIFDHLFAVLPTFGLRAFQAPTGSDVLRLAAP